MPRGHRPIRPLGEPRESETRPVIFRKHRAMRPGHKYICPLHIPETDVWALPASG